MLTLTTTDRSSGVPLSTADVPVTPIVSSIAGENKLSVTWSAASGQTPSEFVELRVQYSDAANPIDRLTVNFGDGSTDIDVFQLGNFADEFFQHTYTTAGPFTISVVLRKSGVIVTSDTVGITPVLSGDFVFDQVQFERLRNDLSEFRVDWRTEAETGISFTDHEVRRGFTYKYRYRLREIDGEGLPGTMSQYSVIATQAPWS